MKSIFYFLSLFTSISTLLCCALPALFVALGFGAALAGVVGSFPQLIWLSEHKIWIFLSGGVLLILGGILQWQARQRSCPVDLVQGEACQAARDWSKPVFMSSVGIYLVGFFFAFIAPSFL